MDTVLCLEHLCGVYLLPVVLTQQLCTSLVPALSYMEGHPLGHVQTRGTDPSSRQKLVDRPVIDGGGWMGFVGLCVVRLGVVRLGVVRLGVVRLGVVRLGVVRLGVVRLGVVRLGVVEGVRHGTLLFARILVYCCKAFVISCNELSR